MKCIYTFFSKTEEKILVEEIKNKNILFDFSPYVDLSKSLTSLEIAFNKSFYFTPNGVKIKFYYDGYADEINKPLLAELHKLKDEGKLNEYVDIDLIYRFLISSMFDFIIYAQSKNINKYEEFVDLKKEYYVNIVYRAILSDKFYKKLKEEI